MVTPFQATTTERVVNKFARFDPVSSSQLHNNFLQTNHQPTTRLFYTNGDEEQCDEQKESNKEAVSKAQMVTGSTKIANSWCFPWRNRSDAPRIRELPAAVKQTESEGDCNQDDEDYDLDKYMEFLARRHNRLHLDDPEGTNNNGVSSDHNSFSNWLFSKPGSESQMGKHEDALYALSWAGFVSHKFHAPWCGSSFSSSLSAAASKVYVDDDAVEVCTEVINEDDKILEVSSREKSNLAKCKNMCAKAVTFCYNYIRKALQNEMRRIVKHVHLVGLVVALLCIKPAIALVAALSNK